MNVTTMIFTPVSGAIIGYFTNWLAIKMLFRPHNEIRVCGIKLPFTPGLIPKERHRLADKVSEAISAHLLTKEVLAESFTSAEVTGKIEALIDKLFEYLSKDERTIGDYLNSYGRAAEIFNSIEKEAAEYILKWAGNEENQKKAAKLITERMLGEKAVKVPDTFISTFKEYVKEKLLLWTQSEDFEALFPDKARDFFNGLLNEERSLREIISADWLISVKSFISDSAPSIAEFVCSIPENNPKFDFALKKALHKVIDDNIGRVASLFINKDKAYENIKESLYSYLRNPENQADLVFKITGAMEKTLDTPVSAILSKIPEASKDAVINKAMYFIKYELSGGIYEKIWEGFESGLTKGSQIGAGMEESIEAFIAGIINRLVLENGASLTEKIPAFVMNKVFEIKIGAYLRKLTPQKADAVKKASAGLAGKLIEKGAAYAAEAIDVAKLTKEQINGLDLAQAEEIVLSVAKRELNAITYFGGILGFIIGLFPVLLEFIAK